MPKPLHHATLWDDAREIRRGIRGWERASQLLSHLRSGLEPPPWELCWWDGGIPNLGLMG